MRFFFFLFIHIFLFEYVRTKSLARHTRRHPLFSLRNFSFLSSPRTPYVSSFYSNYRLLVIFTDLHTIHVYSNVYKSTTSRKNGVGGPNARGAPSSTLHMLLNKNEIRAPMIFFGVENDVFLKHLFAFQIISSGFADTSRV